MSRADRSLSWAKARATVARAEGARSQPGAFFYGLIGQPFGFTPSPPGSALPSQSEVKVKRLRRLAEV